MAKDLFHQVVKDALVKFIEEGIEEYQIYLLVYDVEERSIVKWKK
jgi:hypothetical protein